MPNTLEVRIKNLRIEQCTHKKKNPVLLFLFLMDSAVGWIVVGMDSVSSAVLRISWLRGSKEHFLAA